MPNPRRRPSSQAGFTLLEIMIVLAITTLLLIGVLSGFSYLLRKARFDAAIDQTIQNIAYARNFSVSSVNSQGPGNTTTAVLVGDGIEFDNGHMPDFPLTEIEPVYAQPGDLGQLDTSTLSNWPVGGDASCPASAHPDDPRECFEDFFTLPDTLRVANTGVSEVEIEYVNLGQGLEVCHDVGASFSSIEAACQNTRTSIVNVDLTDNFGFTARIQIDPVTGYAKRID